MTWRDGSVNVRYRVHGTSATATSAEQQRHPARQRDPDGPRLPRRGLSQFPHEHVVPWPRDAASAQRRAAPRLGAALVGVIGLVSALTPEMADRDQDRRRRPAAGLARGCARSHRRLRDRPDLALALAREAPAARLAARGRGRRRLRRRAPREGPRLRGGDDLAAPARALVRWRSRFDVPGDPASVRPLLGLGAALAAIAAVAGGAELRGIELSPRTGDALLGLGVVLGFSRSLLLAAAVRARRRADGGGAADGAARWSMRTAATASPSSPCDATRAISSRRRGRAFLAYRVVAGTALVSGDPVGDEAEIDDLLAELRRIARAQRLAVRGRRRLRRAPRALSRARAQARADRRGGGARPTRVLARGTCDPQGAPVGLPARQGRLLVPRRRGRRGRARAGGRARGRLGRLAARRARARLLDGDRRPPRPRHRARPRGGRRRPGRRLPPSRAVAGGRRLVAERDAPPPGCAERPDRVPRRRGARVGAATRERASCPSTSAR